MIAGITVAAVLALLLLALCVFVCIRGKRVQRKKKVPDHKEVFSFPVVSSLSVVYHSHIQRSSRFLSLVIYSKVATQHSQGAVW